MSIEVWRPVVGLEAMYEVSSHGQVNGLARLDKWGRPVAGGIKPIHMTGPRRSYASVQLARAESANQIRLRMAREGHTDGDIETAVRTGRMMNRKVHRLVLEAFVGPCPPGMVGCHIDGDTANNHLDNLRWDTPSRNEIDKRAHGTHHQVNKTHCPAGHEYSEENTYGGANSTARRCKTCARERAAAQYAKVKAAKGKS